MEIAPAENPNPERNPSAVGLMTEPLLNGLMKLMKRATNNADFPIAEAVTCASGEGFAKPNVTPMRMKPATTPNRNPFLKVKPLRFPDILILME